MIRFIFFKLACLGLPLATQSQPEKYVCGEKKEMKRSYGTVELRVDCKRFNGIMQVSEYKGDTLHGLSQSFDLVSGRKKDSCFYLNEELHGASLVWDSAGNVLARSAFRNGRQVGKQENYFAVGRPSIIKHFNDRGKEEGSRHEWWPNGNKKGEFLAKEGFIITGIEFYPNGKPRVRYKTKYEPEEMSLFKTKRIDAEAWAPDGRPAGKIVKGRGEWLLFPSGEDTTDQSVFREVYRDSLLIKGGKLDSVEAAKWFR